MQIWLKRAYDNPGTKDGIRVLVDRLWPRGVKKEDAQIDVWLKDIAPSDKLRKWYGHDPEKWDEFKRRYFCELNRNEQAVTPLIEIAKKGRVTLVFAAKNERRNNAALVKEYIEGRLRSR